jgi:phosphoenolpyruvate carboxykinase (ATP)
MWDEPVRQHGGLPVASLAQADAADPAAARFVAVLCHDEGVLPAVARLQPAQAAAHLALVDGGPAAVRASTANRFLERLRAGPADAYLVKSGRVGGVDPERSIEVGEGHVAAILDARDAGSIEWELDPDFGYELAAAVPGIEGRDGFLLIPRFLYARTERVYEYAALVPEMKRKRVEDLSALDELDPAMIEAVR